jgi:hypothetical protein
MLRTMRSRSRSGLCTMTSEVKTAALRPEPNPDGLRKLTQNPKSEPAMS